MSTTEPQLPATGHSHGHGHGHGDGAAADDQSSLASLSSSSRSRGSIDSRDHDVLPLDPLEQRPPHAKAGSAAAAPQDEDESSSPPRRTASRASLASIATLLRTATSRASSRKSNIVRGSERRGLFASLALVPEYEDAREYPRKIKFFIVFVVAFAAITGPMGTSIMLPAIDDVASNLHTSVSVVNVSVGLYLIALGIFPLWWSALSESLGRRTIYVISFTMFCAFSVGSALSPSIGALLAFRVLCGGCSASVQAVGAGTIGDLFVQQERGRAMGFYYLGPLMGPFLAPILGGAVAEAWGWRATQWLMVIFSGLNVVFILFGLPETLRKQDSATAIRDILRRQLSKENTDYEAGMGDGTAGPLEVVATGDHHHHHHRASGGDEKAPACHDSAAPCKHEETDSSKHEETDSSKHEETDSSDLSEDRNGIPSNITNTNGNHDFTEKELERIATNLSRRYSAQEGEDLGDVAMDGITPSLSRLNTNRSAYSRRICENSKQAELEAALAAAVEEERQQAAEESKVRWQTKAYNYAIRPLHSLVLLRYPPVLLVIIFSACCFGGIYFFNMGITYGYARDPYNFKTIIIGLLYIPNSLTYVAASIIGGRWNDNLLRKYADAHNGELNPESRLSWNLVTAVVLYLPSCLIFGWCMQHGTFWFVPLVGTACFGFASMLVIGACVTYLVDTLPGKGATGVALNNLVRMMIAAMATFVVEPAWENIGPGKLFSIVMSVMISTASAVYAVKRFGPYFRKNYDLGKLYDLL